MSEKPAILIGKKPLMNYVLACFTAIQSGTNELTIKARGKAISRAVDVVQILQRRFFNDLQVKDIKIGTEQLTGENNVTVNVSTIEINVTRKK